MPTLVVSLPDGAEVSYELTQAQMTIGRVAENAIHIEDPSISTRHAELTLIGKDYHLKDLGSTNGTQINGVDLTESKKLRDGDSLRFGNVCAVYQPQSLSGDRQLPTEKQEASKPAESSQKPTDFGNASPFQRKRGGKDIGGPIAIAAFVLAVLVFGAAAFMTISIVAPKF